MSENLDRIELNPEEIDLDSISGGNLEWELDPITNDYICYDKANADDIWKCKQENVLKAMKEEALRCKGLTNQQIIAKLAGKGWIYK